LKRFRFDVKDRSHFVAGLPDSPDDVSLVKAILAMAKGLTLGWSPKAWNARLVDFLTIQGCDHVQGYFHASPDSEAT
jgi:EAL domain-containing protein (putative c-di-GMP-specific phosphodiesterase class I)